MRVHFLVDIWSSSCCVLNCWKKRGCSLPGVYFIRALIPFMRALSLWPNHFPKAPPSNTITMGNRSQHMKFGVHKFLVYGNSHPFYGALSLPSICHHWHKLYFPMYLFMLCFCPLECDLCKGRVLIYFVHCMSWEILNSTYHIVDI